MLHPASGGESVPDLVLDRTAGLQAGSGNIQVNNFYGAPAWGNPAGAPTTAAAAGSASGSRGEARGPALAGGPTARGPWPGVRLGSRLWPGAAVVTVLAIVAYILIPSPGPDRSPAGARPATPGSPGTSPSSPTVTGTGPATGAVPGATLTVPGSGAVSPGVTTSPDGTIAVAASSNSGGTLNDEIALFSSSGKQQASTLPIANSYSHEESPSFDPRDRNLVAFGDGTSIEVYDRASRSYRLIADPNGSIVTAVTYTGNGADLVEADSAGDVYVLNASSGQTVDTYTANANEQVSDLSVSQSANVVAATDNDTVLVWGPRGGPPATIATATGDAVSPDGKSVAVRIGADVQIWNVAGQSLGPRLAGPGRFPYVMAFSPDGKTLAVGDGDGHIYLWNLTTGQPVTVNCAITSWGGLVFSPNGKTLTVYGSHASQAYVYNVSYQAS